MPPLPSTRDATAAVNSRCHRCRRLEMPSKSDITVDSRSFPLSLSICTLPSTSVENLRKVCPPLCETSHSPFSNLKPPRIGPPYGRTRRRFRLIQPPEIYFPLSWMLTNIFGRRIQAEMEAVCLNSEPLFDEGDEYEDEGDCSMMDQDDEISEIHSQKERALPTIGLEFESFDEAYNFYNVYAKEQGFGIRVSNSWFRSKRKERYRAKLSCSSAGFKKKSEANNPRPETRTGCPAMIVIKLVDSKRWRIVEVEIQHNHPVSPDVKRFYKSHKKMILAAKEAQQLEPVMEVHTIKLYRTAAVDVVSTLQRKYLKEAMGDLESRNSKLELKTRCNFELQLSKEYTLEIFKKFQSEVEGMYSCFNTRQVNVNGPIITYVVKERVEIEGREKEVRNYEVLYETTEVDIRCICSLFNFKGYLCRHALNVLNYNGVEEIPSRYILPRWCKDFKRIYPLDYGTIDDIDVNDPVQWYNHLYRRVIQVVEQGAQSQQHYKAALQGLEDLLHKFSLVEDSLF
ncbi:hypothetical protein Vadar_017564 [Vaccinium darrowii]|uniref:Uncharacterized protein n=1 Tax=Vaccinium darrowii TaxID=229202 RepID=A0ACB7XI72_9ERIC|nr:hypothetical protein Vadar_017564 [Vaccinium darrowii]